MKCVGFYELHWQFVTENAVVLIMGENIIEKAMHPLLLTASIVGLGAYPKKFYTSILYNLTVWIAYCFLYYYVVIAFKIEKWYLSLSAIIMMHTSIFTIVVSVILSSYQEKKFRIILKRLAAVNDTLTKLGTRKTYEKLRAASKWALIVWFAFSFVANANDMIWWLRNEADHRFMIIPFVINHYQHVNMLVEIIFLTLVWYIGTKFDEIYQHMQQLLVKREHELRCTWQKATLTTRDCVTHPANYKRVLWTSMHLHLELCKIARELNSIFGKQLTTEMAAFLIYVTILCHFLFICFQKRLNTSINEWLDFYLWTFIYVIRLFWINYICESVSVKANKIDRILHQFTDILRYADLRTEICQFTLQVIHYPLRFTGLGLFYFGNGFLWKFFVKVTTFVILMMQMSTLPVGLLKKK